MILLIFKKKIYEKQKNRECIIANFVNIVLTNPLYRFNNVDTGDLKTVLDAFNIKIKPELYTKKLKEHKQTIDIFK